MRISDWSSDVCSSDLIVGRLGEVEALPAVGAQQALDGHLAGRLPLGAGRRIAPVLRHPAAVDQDDAAVVKPESGRASCRERVCQYVSISVVAVSLNKKPTNKYTKQLTETTIIQ